MTGSRPCDATEMRISHGKEKNGARTSAWFRQLSNWKRMVCLEAIIERLSSVRDGNGAIVAINLCIVGLSVVWRRRRGVELIFVRVVFFRTCCGTPASRGRNGAVKSLSGWKKFAFVAERGGIVSKNALLLAKMPLKSYWRVTRIVCEVGAVGSGGNVALWFFCSNAAPASIFFKQDRYISMKTGFLQ